MLRTNSDCVSILHYLHMYERSMETYSYARVWAMRNVNPMGNHCELSAM